MRRELLTLEGPMDGTMPDNKTRIRRRVEAVRRPLRRATRNSNQFSLTYHAQGLLLVVEVRNYPKNGNREPEVHFVRPKGGPA